MSDKSNKPRVRVVDGNVIPASMFDSLTNLVAGLGTERDKRYYNKFSFGTIGVNWVEMEAAYLDNWISRQIVEVPVDDGVREWRTFTCEQAPDIVKEEDRLRVAHYYKLARYWSRLYGGAVIVMITDQSLDQPLEPEKIKQGGLKRLVVLDRWDIKPQFMNFFNPMSESYLMPEYYIVTGGTQRIHHSHVIRCDGEELPRRLRMLNEGWGDSTLRKVLEDVKDVAATKGGIASLVLEANVDTVSREGLSDELASGQEDNILKRFALAGQMKSLIGMMLLDGTEQYERKSVTFAGLAQVMDKFMIWISGAADIPMTRLFGRSAAGMNATGEGDLNNYYDKVASMQESLFRKDLEQLDEVLIRSAIGQIPEDCEFEWNPLYQESGLELAQQDLALSQSEDSRINNRVLKRSHVMMRLKNEGKYAITDEEIQKAQQQEKEEEDAFEAVLEEEPVFTGEGEEENPKGEEVDEEEDKDADDKS